MPGGYLGTNIRIRCSFPAKQRLFRARGLGLSEFQDFGPRVFRAGGLGSGISGLECSGFDVI